MAQSIKITNMVIPFSNRTFLEKTSITELLDTQVK